MSKSSTTIWLVMKSNVSGILGVVTARRTQSEAKKVATDLNHCAGDHRCPHTGLMPFFSVSKTSLVQTQIKNVVMADK